MRNCSLFVASLLALLSLSETRATVTICDPLAKPLQVAPPLYVTPGMSARYSVYDAGGGDINASATVVTLGTISYSRTAYTPVGSGSGIINFNFTGTTAPQSNVIPFGPPTEQTIGSPPVSIYENANSYTGSTSYFDPSDPEDPQNPNKSPASNATTFFEGNVVQDGAATATYSLVQQDWEITVSIPVDVVAGFNNVNIPPVLASSVVPEPVALYGLSTFLLVFSRRRFG